MMESTRNRFLNHADSNAGLWFAEIQKMINAPTVNTTMSQIAWAMYGIHTLRYLTYSQENTAPPTNTLTLAIKLAHQGNPKTANATV